MNPNASAAQRRRFGSARDRVAARYTVNGETGCWEWDGTRMQSGYGCLFENGKRQYAHRVSFERVHGEIPAGLVLDHLCRVRHCINPDHLEPVTRRVNNMRGAHPLAVAWRTNTCRRGHDLLIHGRTNGPGKRCCGLCRRERARKAT